MNEERWKKAKVAHERDDLNRKYTNVWFKLVINERLIELHGGCSCLCTPTGLDLDCGACISCWCVSAVQSARPFELIKIEKHSRRRIAKQLIYKVVFHLDLSCRFMDTADIPISSSISILVCLVLTDKRQNLVMSILHKRRRRSSQSQRINTKRLQHYRGSCHQIGPSQRLYSPSESDALVSSAGREPSDWQVAEEDTILWSTRVATRRRVAREHSNQAR